METVHNNGEYPRALSTRERGWLEWILPGDRPAYASYREMIASMMVIGQGRRGPGEIIIGAPGDKPDFAEPLTPVVAYGTVETDVGTISITLREPIDGQLSAEMVCHSSEEIPPQYREVRRWTYSRWNPGDPCPQCLNAVREVPMRTASSAESSFALALCVKDKRIWVYEGATGMNRLIPLTNFYNELMLHKNVRDPRIALDVLHLFRDLPAFSDDDLAYAFLTYNRIKTKVRASGRIEAVNRETPGIRNAVRKLLKLKS